MALFPPPGHRPANVAPGASHGVRSQEWSGVWRGGIGEEVSCCGGVGEKSEEGALEGVEGEGGGGLGESEGFQDEDGGVGGEGEECEVVLD